jgi:hypothetical protein
MQNMPNMLAYTIQSSNYAGGSPSLTVGQGRTATGMRPQSPQDDSYWIVIIDSMNPQNKVKEWVVPGSSNSSVPPDLDGYMSNPQYIFAVVTQYLSTLHVPQGDFYDYLVKYGAGRQLQRLEQLTSVFSYSSFGRMNYLLTGMGGPRGGGNPPPPSYELGSFSGEVLSLMSLMPGPNGQPPYAICDSNTVVTR